MSYQLWLSKILFCSSPIPSYQGEERGGTYRKNLEISLGKKVGWPGKVFPMQKILGPCEALERVRLWPVIVTLHSCYSRVCHVMGTRYTLVPWMKECQWTSNIVWCTTAVPHRVTRSLFLQKVHSDFFLNIHLGCIFYWDEKSYISNAFLSLHKTPSLCSTMEAGAGWQVPSSLLHHVAEGFWGLDFTQSKDCVGVDSCSWCSVVLRQRMCRGSWVSAGWCEHSLGQEWRGGGER